MSHTPGPWIITSYNYFIRSNSEDVVIAEIYQGDYIEGRPSFRCGQANANLIAAAPEMLEALEALVNLGCHYGSKRDEVVNALAVIAKARGEQ